MMMSGRRKPEVESEAEAEAEADIAIRRQINATSINLDIQELELTVNSHACHDTLPQMNLCITGSSGRFFR